MNGVLIRRGFPDQSRTPMEGDGSYPSGCLSAAERHGKDGAPRLENYCGRTPQREPRGALLRIIES